MLGDRRARVVVGLVDLLGWGLAGGGQRALDQRAKTILKVADPA